MNEKILIIDDEKEICALLRDFLEKEGYKVKVATSASEGIEIFKKERPKIVILDVRMPKINGIEAMIKIREMDNTCGIIMATAIVDKKVVDEAIRLGAADYIVKPFDLDYLRRSVLAKISVLME